MPSQVMLVIIETETDKMGHDGGGLCSSYKGWIIKQQTIIICDLENYQTHKKLGKMNNMLGTGHHPPREQFWSVQSDANDKF